MVTTTFLPVVGGLQFQLKWLLDNLDRRIADEGMDFHFACPGYSHDFADFKHIAVHDIGKGGSGVYTVRLITSLRRLIRHIRPDIVHCHGLMPDGFAAAVASMGFRTATKIVVTSHGHDVVWLPRVPYGSLGQWKRRLQARFVIQRLTAHVGVGRTIAYYATRAGTPQERVRVIHNGVPNCREEDFEVRGTAPLPSNTPDIRRRDNGMNILTLSSGRPVKNLDTLIEAVAIARDRLGDSVLYLSCDGPLAEPIRSLVARKGLADMVNFIGVVTGKAKHACLRACDIYCLPSYFEAFGLVALEAMKYGNTVVATREGGVPDFRGRRREWTADPAGERGRLGTRPDTAARGSGPSQATRCEGSRDGEAFFDHRVSRSASSPLPRGGRWRLARKARTDQPSSGSVDRLASTARA